jgi:uncharacterized protein (DUF2345 family)
LQLSTPAGIAAVTPASAVFSAGTSTAIGAGQDINFATSGSWFQSAKSGISLFTYGKAGNANKPGKETGIRLHAGTGKVSSQSQDGETRLTADKAVTVASVTKTVSVGAREHVLLTAQRAFIKLCGGNIELHGPGKVEFKATMKELTGPQSSHFAGHEFPTSAMKPNRLVIERRYHDDEPLAGLSTKSCSRMAARDSAHSTVRAAPRSTMCLLAPPKYDLAPCPGSTSERI